MKCHPDHHRRKPKARKVRAKENDSDEVLGLSADPPELRLTRNEWEELLGNSNPGNQLPLPTFSPPPEPEDLIHSPISGLDEMLGLNHLDDWDEFFGLEPQIPELSLGPVSQTKS
jgi:hypothetical protein